MVRAGSGQVSSRSLAAGLGIPSGQPPTRAPPSTTQTALGAAVGAVYGSHDRRVTVCPYSGWPGVWGPHWRCCLRSRTASGYPVKCNTAYCSTTRGRSRARTGPGRTTPGRPGRTAGTGSTTHRRPGGPTPWPCPDGRAGLVDGVHGQDTDAVDRQPVQVHLGSVSVSVATLTSSFRVVPAGEDPAQSVVVPGCGSERRMGG
jgi:hypothetical protein